MKLNAKKFEFTVFDRKERPEVVLNLNSFK